MPPKRKAADGDESLSSGKKAKPTKSTTTTKRGRGKKNAEVEIEEESKPRVKRINKHLKAKVQQIADLIDTTERYQSRLKWSDSHENCVVVSEACLLGSLMAMHADWGLTDPRMASLIEVGEAIVEQYEKKRAMNEEMVKMVVLDVSKETAFVEGIQQKIEGWGLEVCFEVISWVKRALLIRLCRASTCWRSSWNSARETPRTRPPFVCSPLSSRATGAMMVLRRSLTSPTRRRKMSRLHHQVMKTPSTATLTRQPSPPTSPSPAKASVPPHSSPYHRT